MVVYQKALKRTELAGQYKHANVVPPAHENKGHDGVVVEADERLAETVNGLLFRQARVEIENLPPRRARSQTALAAESTLAKQKSVRPCNRVHIRLRLAAPQDLCEQESLVSPVEFDGSMLAKGDLECEAG